MQRPLVEFSHRLRTLYLRERPEWAELSPHLKQVGIQVEYQEKLPKWDDARRTGPAALPGYDCRVQNKRLRVNSVLVGPNVVAGGKPMGSRKTAMLVDGWPSPVLVMS